MRKFGKILLIGLAFGLVTAVLGFLTSKPAPAQHPPHVEPVKVTNTPLPVQGNVNANVSGTVAVSSLPPVTLNGMSSVQIANTTANPVLNRDIDRPANQPFNVELCDDALPLSGFTQQKPCFFFGETSLEVIVIPTTTSSGQAVQRLVIEYVSGSCNQVVPNSVNGVGLVAGSSLNLVPGTPPNPGTHFFPLTAWNGQFPVVQWAEPVHMYCDPGSALSFGVSAPSGSVSGCSMFITGYLTVA